MADKTELQMNLVAVKRVDPYAKDIIDSSAHVAFYTFNSDESEWEKTDVEGVFFIYSRNAEPLHSIFINNRLNTNSFIEPITGQLELQSQPPFLLYRNERSRIRGFWFYNSSECDRIGELVGRLVKECETSKLTTVSKNHEITRSNANANANNVDIFSMLSKAQEDFNNSQNQVVNRMQPTMPTGPGPTSQVATTNPPPVINNNQPDVTSQSVMNFFAAAKPAAASEVPLFQRLMSKPVPVDQIEKQQRATTPQDGRMSPASVMHHNVMNLGHQQHQHQSICNNSVGGIESAFNLINLSSPKQYNQDLGTSPLAKFLVTSAVATTIGGGGGGVGILQQQQQQQQPPPHHKAVSASEIENSQKPLQQLLRKESTGIMQVIQQGGQQQSSATISAAAAAAAASAVVATVPSNKPALMPPTMFLTSSSVSKTITTTKEPSISNMQIANCIQRQHSLSGGGGGNDSGGGGGGGGVVNVDVGSTILTPTVVTGGGGGSGSGSAAINYSRPEPLTQTQLVQAMMYMIQNDPEFIKKLHEAYLKSFTDMVSL